MTLILRNEFSKHIGRSTARNILENLNLISDYLIFSFIFDATVCCLHRESGIDSLAVLPALGVKCVCKFLYMGDFSRKCYSIDLLVKSVCNYWNFVENDGTVRNVWKRKGFGRLSRLKWNLKRLTSLQSRMHPDS